MHGGSLAHRQIIAPAARLPPPVFTRAAPLPLGSLPAGLPTQLICLWQGTHHYSTSNIMNGGSSSNPITQTSAPFYPLCRPRRLETIYIIYYARFLDFCAKNYKFCFMHHMHKICPKMAKMGNFYSFWGKIISPDA